MAKLLVGGFVIWILVRGEWGKYAALVAAAPAPASSG